LEDCTYNTASSFLKYSTHPIYFQDTEGGKYIVRKEGFPMAEHERQQGDFFRGFLIGGILGALAGILFAPKSGKELRSDIKEKGSEVIEVLEEGKEIYADARKRAKEIIDEARHQAKELKREADRHLSEARQKAKEILARGENVEREIER